MTIMDKNLEEYKFEMNENTYLEFPIQKNNDDQEKSDSSDSEKKDAEYDILQEDLKKLD
jgi:hypothetical protein